MHLEVSVLSALCKIETFLEVVVDCCAFDFAAGEVYF